MKKLILFLLVGSFAYANGVIDTSMYDKLFDSLAKKREGLSNDLIIALKDPFPSLKSERIIDETARKLGYVVNGIFGDSVKINDRWYKIGDDIGAYKVEKIIEKDKRVILSNEVEEVNLKLRQGNRNVKIEYK